MTILDALETAAAEFAKQGYEFATINSKHYVDLIAVARATEAWFANGDPSGGPDYDTGQYLLMETLSVALAPLLADAN